jgi:type VI secretion system protein ImpC
MPASFSFGEIQLDVSLGDSPARSPRDAESPFMLLIAADFSGRTNRGVIEPMAGRRPVHVDCDNFEKVMAGLGGTLSLPAARPGVPAVELRIETVEDFHPDNLVKQVDSLAALIRTRRRLQSPATAADALVDAGRLLAAPSVSAESGSTPAASSASGESTQDTLARLMGGPPPKAAPPARPGDPGIAVSALIKNIVGPNVVSDATPEQMAALAAIEVELAAQLRAILHHPDFQALEVAWRRLDQLVREFGGEEQIKLFLLDASKAELSADLKAVKNLSQTGLVKSLRDEPWALMIGAYIFDDSVEDLEVLGRVAKVAALLGAPFVAGASSQMVGCVSLADQPDADEWRRVMSPESREAWSALRSLPEAAHLGLVLPRVLSRQPYGKGSDVVEAFGFEELSGDGPHESYLWGNGAFVCGFVLAEAFRAEGWEMTATRAGEMDDLPVHKFSKDGETQVKPCAEAWLSERVGDRIGEQGVMALLSVKGRGAVRLAELRSVALPAQPLALRRG